jgi:small subunit ribosomal protein S17
MRTKSGIVISNTNDKTIVVKVDRYVIHPIYKKRYRVSKKFHAHDEKAEAQIGDIVEISECKPISKLKCWKLDKVVAKSAQAIVSTPAAVKTEDESELEATKREKETPKEEVKKEEKPSTEEKPAEETKEKSE